MIYFQQHFLNFNEKFYYYQIHFEKKKSFDAKYFYQFLNHIIFVIIIKIIYTFSQSNKILLKINYLHPNLLYIFFFF